MGNLLEALGLTWWNLLFYVINIGVLLLVYLLLVHKKVKKFVEAKRKKSQEVFEENERLNAESAELRAKYDNMLAEAKQEVARISEETTDKANAKAQEILADYTLKAEELLKSAKSEIAAERARLEQEYKNNVKELSLEVARKILEREVTEKDNKKVLDECLKQWGN